MINDHNGARSLNEITGRITDADLNEVSGGEKTTTTKPKTPPEKFMVYTMEQVLVSSYQVGSTVVAWPQAALQQYARQDGRALSFKTKFFRDETRIYQPKSVTSVCSV